MEQARGPRHLTGSHRGLRNVYGAMNAATVDAIGLFDEWAFYPIYFDDDDYEYRCRQGGVEWLTYDGTIQHAGSQTITDPRMARENSRTYQLNAARYVAKWGGLPGHECYSRPYDLPVPLSYTAPDIAGRAVRTWNTR
jgi:GT2 family glycosyltransferase